MLPHAGHRDGPPQTTRSPVAQLGLDLALKEGSEELNLERH